MMHKSLVPLLLSGKKWQTRRVVKGSPMFITPLVNGPLGGPKVPTGEFGLHFHSDRVIDKHVRCPWGEPGDRLWVRETWGVYRSEKSWTDCGYEYDGDFIRGPLRGKTYSKNNNSDREGVNEFVVYRADGIDEDGDTWRPSIHMPRWASRILLEIEDVRVERLWELTAADATAEGMECPQGRSHEQCNCVCSTFEKLWRSLDEDTWNKNAYVWALSFKRLQP